MSDEIRVTRDPRDTRPLVENRESTGAGTAAAPARAREEGESRNRQNREPEPIMPLFSGSDSQNLRSRWEGLQVGFVDEPRQAVEQADRLVSETIDTLSRGFAGQREKLEQQWHRGEDVSTEDLRLALRRYRSFFERLLSI